MLFRSVCRHLSTGGLCRRKYTMLATVMVREPSCQHTGGVVGGELSFVFLFGVQVEERKQEWQNRKPTQFIAQDNGHLMKAGVQGTAFNMHESRTPKRWPTANPCIQTGPNATMVRHALVEHDTKQEKCERSWNTPPNG